MIFIDSIGNEIGHFETVVAYPHRSISISKLWYRYFSRRAVMAVDVPTIIPHPPTRRHVSQLLPSYTDRTLSYQWRQWCYNANKRVRLLMHFVLAPPGYPFLFKLTRLRRCPNTEVQEVQLETSISFTHIGLGSKNVRWSSVVCMALLLRVWKGSYGSRCDWIW